MWAGLRLLSRALSSVLNQLGTGIKMKHLQRRIGLNVLFASALAALSGLVVAQQPSQQQVAAIKQACRADYQANCASVPTGGQAALNCLQQNAANTSPGCQQALAGGAAPAPVAAAPAAAPMTQPTPQQQQAIKQACRADYQANCASVPTGGQAALNCLQQNAANTSPGCQQALGGGGEPAAAAAAPAAGMTQPTAQQQQAIKQACRSDFQKQCAGVPTGGQAALSCLQQNAANTSPGCQQALSGGGGDAAAAAAAPAAAPPGGVLLRGHLRRQAW
jgi:hypothetical protein